jgi:hypothetical protein
MPNYWEAARGFNPNLADHNGIGPNGYTNLENYLNYLTLIANWNADAGGNWSTIRNWAGTVPNATDATANFGPVTSAPRTITLDAPMTVGQLNFDSAHAYTLAGPAPLTLDVISGIAAVIVASGAHTIEAPVLLAGDTVVTIAAPNGALSITSPLSAVGKTITKEGAGDLRLGSFDTGALAIDAGRLQLLAGQSGPHKLKLLTIAPAASLDMTDRNLVIDYDGGSPLASIRSLLASGYAGGSWNGNGINSSSAAGASGHAVGYADASALGITQFGGIELDGSAVLLAYTLYGDTDLNQTVNLSDFNRLAANFGRTNKLWSDGDFNFDGAVSLSDFNLLAASFGLSATGPDVTPQDWSALAAAVPEPGATLLVLSGVPASAGMRRRRGHR